MTYIGLGPRMTTAAKDQTGRNTGNLTNAFTAGFDGWIYACLGFSNTSTVEGSDREPINLQ